MLSETPSVLTWSDWSVFINVVLVLDNFLVVISLTLIAKLFNFSLVIYSIVKLLSYS